MCGIAGIVGKNKNHVHAKRLQDMTDVIIHRGPDGGGHWINDDGNVGLGHRRLSIIDLSESGKQPMHYMERYTITFNGEIYNYIELKQTLVNKGYKFYSHSDTEVIMALYDDIGEKCLNLLDGMFAFAIYDKKERKLFCARDRFGEKPFHYIINGGDSFYFASEMKQFWAIGFNKTVDHSMLANYLTNGFVQNPDNLSQTFFEGIQRLNPAHYLILDTETLSLKINKYWDIQLQPNNSYNGSFEDACVQFRELFENSVKRRLRSDVPVGSSLSGGLDSSLVVSVIHQLNADAAVKQKTFSARFPGFKKDESYYQDLVIKRTNAQAYFVEPKADLLYNHINRVFYHQEEPFGSSSILVQHEVFKLAKDNHVIVLLDGQGADEVLAGYHYFYPYFFNELDRSSEYKKEWQAYLHLHESNSINGAFKKDWKYLLKRNFPSIIQMGRKWRDSLLPNIGDLNSDYADSYFKGNIFKPQSNYNTLNGILKQTATGGFLHELLRYADRNSMAQSREVRLPFLNHNLVEFLFSLPAQYKIHDGWTKYLMRKSYNSLLPEEITWRKDKIGYEPPQKSWMSDKKMLDIIQSSREKLVDQNILSKNVLSKGIKPEDALSTGNDNTWRFLMADRLLDTK